MLPGCCAVKGIAKAQNFLMGFFKRSAETTIKVHNDMESAEAEEEEQDGEPPPASSSRSFRHGSRGGASLKRNQSTGAQAGLLLYTVGDKEGGVDDVDGIKAAAHRKAAAPPLSFLSQQSLPRRAGAGSNRGMAAGESSSDGEDDDVDDGDSDDVTKSSFYLPDISIPGGGSVRRIAALSKSPLPSMFGNGRLRDSVLIFPPQRALAGVGAPVLPDPTARRGASTPDVMGASGHDPRNVTSASGHSGLSGLQSSKSLSPTPPSYDDIGGGVSGRFNRMAGRSFTIPKSNGLSSPRPRDASGGSDVPTSPHPHPHLGVMGLPEGASPRVRPNRMALGAYSPSVDSIGPWPSGGDDLEVTILGGGASTSGLMRTRFSNVNGGSRRAMLMMSPGAIPAAHEGAAAAGDVDDAGDGEAEDILRSMSSPMLRQPSLRAPRVNGGNAT